MLGLKEHGDACDLLTREASTVEAGADGVLWAPYLMGERTPHLDPNVRGGLVGLAASHTRGHIMRAVLEGAAFSLRDSFTILSEARRARSAHPSRRRRRPFCTLAPDSGRRCADMRSRSMRADEGAAYGAALLAGVGAGVWPDVDAACDRLVTSSVAASPNAATVAIMNQRYAAYRRVYPALRVMAGRQ